MGSYILTLDTQFLIQVVWQLLNTAILCGALAFILYKPVLAFMAKRKERIANEISTAEQNREDAEKLKTEYEAKLKEIEKEREEILENARAQAKKKELEIIADANKEAEVIKNRATLDIQREQEKAKDEIRKQIIEVSSLMASRFVSASISESEQDKLIDEAISDLGDVTWIN